VKRLEGYDVFPISASEIIVDYDSNCRGYFTLQSVESLAKDIERKGYPYGLDIPVIVRLMPDKTYRLVCGHRRFTACVKFLKWEKIPAQVRQLTDEQATDLNFTENLLRSDLNILQEAIYLGRVYKDKSCREIQEKIGKPTRWILARRKLLTLPEEIQIKAAAGLLTAANLEVIARQSTAAEQLECAAKIAEVKKKGKTATHAELPGKYQPSFHGRRNKGMLRDKTSYLFGRGITSGLPPRLLAWAGAEINDQDLEPDIEEYLAMLKELEEWRTGQRP
jgi:ParB family chromosome partitioning protein